MTQSMGLLGTAYHILSLFLLFGIRDATRRDKEQATQTRNRKTDLLLSSLRQPPPWSSIVTTPSRYHLIKTPFHRIHFIESKHHWPARITCKSVFLPSYPPSHPPDPQFPVLTNILTDPLSAALEMNTPSSPPPSHGTHLLRTCTSQNALRTRSRDTWPPTASTHGR
jgi:hypothetical protein